MDLHSGRDGLHKEGGRGVCAHGKRHTSPSPAHNGSQRLKKLLEGFADAGPLAVQLGDVLCKVFNRAGDVAPAHAVAAVDVVAAPAVI